MKRIRNIVFFLFINIFWGSLFADTYFLQQGNLRFTLEEVEKVDLSRILSDQEREVFYKNFVIFIGKITNIGGDILNLSRYEYFSYIKENVFCETCLTEINKKLKRCGYNWARIAALVSNISGSLCLFSAFLSGLFEIDLKEQGFLFASALIFCVSFFYFNSLSSKFHDVYEDIKCLDFFLQIDGLDPVKFNDGFMMINTNQTFYDLFVLKRDSFEQNLSDAGWQKNILNF